jgi:hypothetical protein
MGLGAQPHARAAFHPLPVGVERGIDLVVEHVVIDEIVLVEETTPALKLLFGRIRGDIPLPRALEHGDVLGLAARSRVGEAVESSRVHFGYEVARLRQQRPRLAAQVAEVEHE